MSPYVMEALSNALLELMEEKPLDKITVDALCARAAIGRATYFRNFKSKEEILEAYLARSWRTFEEQNRLLEHPINSSDRLSGYFRFCYHIRGVNDRLIAQGKSELILRVYNRVFQNQDISNLLAQRNYARVYAAYGLFGVFLQWAIGGYRESVDEMTALVRDKIYADYRMDSLS